MTQEAKTTKFDYWHAKYIEELENKRQWKKIAVNREGDNNGLRADVESLKAETARWRRETKKTRVKLAQTEEAARELMDETELEHEGSRSRNLRRFVWNDEDSEALRQAEGIDE